ncbi:hypothetical protein V7S43_004140 [Phytophthora oleae]|uniref:BZIP domain-containing protein n=1 Tax=Phytophthora oleae TaxID=2107226 RepID=A0ABD3FZ62_9STRA
MSTGTSTQEDAQMVTLDELFEFIDCCVCPDVFTDSLEVNDPWCEHAMLPALEFPMDKTRGSPSTTDQTPPDLKISKPPCKPKRRRIRTGWSSSTGLQRRKRAELQFLREHVRDLEAYAEKLKKRVGLVQEAKEDDKRSCNWQEMAAVEFTERQKAEETNRALKRIMDTQMQVSTALHMIAQHNAIV